MKPSLEARYTRLQNRLGFAPGITFTQPAAQRWMRTALAVLALFLLPACRQGMQAETQAAIPTQMAPTSTERPRDPILSAAAPTKPAASNSIQACQEDSGQVLTSTLEDPNLSRPLPYRIYLPPCHDQQRPGGYPAVYLLHGLGRTESQWDDLGADEKADELLGMQRISPFLIVMPWERTGIELESAVVDSLLPHIERTYNASPERQGRAIGGISRGAGWALRIGLNHPELFRAIGLHSPAVLSPDLFNLPGWAESISAGYPPLIWIDIGERDPLLSAALELKTLLDQLGISYQSSLNEGYHEERYWAAHLVEYLEWYSGIFSATPPENGVQ